jgi:CelD/BcsL family acetyltransferase involved in cellulose biosynthesis
MVAAAPLEIEHSLGRGRTLQWLAGGEVCSDYQSLLATPEFLSQATEAIADYLCTEASDVWDMLQLDAVDDLDRSTARLVDALERRNCGVYRRPMHNCWRLALPESWDDYLAMLSKSHRKQVRRLQDRTLDTPRATFHSAVDSDQWRRGWDVLVDLHQRRRQSLGQQGCFASPRFAAFHEETSRRLLDQGRLRLDWLELDGEPIAAEYHVSGRGVVFAYQAGVDPERLDEEPGRLVSVALLRKAIADRMTAIDFLRGDEPYKAHWRAEPRPCSQIRIVSPRLAPRLRNRISLAGLGVRRLIKSTLALARLRESEENAPGKSAARH